MKKNVRKINSLKVPVKPKSTEYEVNSSPSKTSWFDKVKDYFDSYEGGVNICLIILLFLTIGFSITPMFIIIMFIVFNIIIIITNLLS